MALVVLLGVSLAPSSRAAMGSTDRASGAGAAEPPSMLELTRRAARQQFTPAALLGNDQVDVRGLEVSARRIDRAWQTAKRVHLGDPQDPAKARELRDLYERYERTRLELNGKDRPDTVTVAGARMQLLQPGVLWPGETDRDRRMRLAAALATDKATSGNFWKDVADANGEEASGAVKAVCGAIALGPTVLGALANALRPGKDDGEELREACEQVGRRTEDAVGGAAGAVGDFVKDPLGALAKGVFGPIIGELHKATVYASKQVGAAIDKVATPDLGEQWVREMLRRAATIALLIALVAGILGVAHAAVTANLGALATVAARACLSGIVGSAVLTVITIAVAFVDELTTIVTGADPDHASKPFATLAETASSAMAKAELPSFVTLLLLLALLLGLVVVWWEMWLRAPLLYAVAFFYGPAFSASLFPPARQVLSHLNSLLAAIVLMPLVSIALLQMAAESLQGQDTVAAVLQATGLILLAAAAPGILIALFSPGVGLAAAAGIAGAFAGTRTMARAGGTAASAGLGAATFARERLKSASDGGSSAGSTGGPSGPGGGGVGPTGLSGGGDGGPRPGGTDSGLAASTPNANHPTGPADTTRGDNSAGTSADGDRDGRGDGLRQSHPDATTAPGQPTTTTKSEPTAPDASAPADGRTASVETGRGVSSATSGLDTAAQAPSGSPASAAPGRGAAKGSPQAPPAGARQHAAGTSTPSSTSGVARPQTARVPPPDVRPAASHPRGSRRPPSGGGLARPDTP